MVLLYVIEMAYRQRKYGSCYSTRVELVLQIEKFKKYAKYKAAYIHRCLKSGETPVPGPVTEEGEDLGKRRKSRHSPYVIGSCSPVSFILFVGLG